MKSQVSHKNLFSFYLPIVFFLIVLAIFTSGYQDSSVIYGEGLNEGITSVQYPGAQQSAYYYTGIWNGQRVYLQLVPNVTVETLPDATIIGTLSNFYTNQPGYLSPPYAELNGESLNIWAAPSEFQGEYVVHNGDEGPQPTYGTWIIISAQQQAPPPPPIAPQSQPSVNITVETPYFITYIGEGVGVYYLPAVSGFAFSYNGFYFSWVNNVWEYSNYYYGPWLSLTPVIVLPPPLLYGPPPPVFAYKPYFFWWRRRISPWYRVYHPGWWYRHRFYMTHYKVWQRRVLPFYARHPFYHGEMHRIIRPVGGRFIFPKGIRPEIVRGGQVIYPRGLRSIPFRRLHVPVRFRPVRHFKPIKPIIPVRRPISPPFPQRRIRPITPPGVRPPSQYYTTGPIMKHPRGIYRGIGIPPHKPVNRKPPVYRYFPAKPVEHLPVPPRPLMPPSQKFSPLRGPVIAPPNNAYHPNERPNIYHPPSLIRPVPVYHPPVIQRRYGVPVPHRIIGRPAPVPHGKVKQKGKKRKNK